MSVLNKVYLKDKLLLKILTGGSGFIGSNLVIQTLEQGHEVLNIDLLTYASCQSNLEHLTIIITLLNKLILEINLCFVSY